MTKEDPNIGPREIERLFARRKISRTQFVQAMVALGVSAGGLEALFGQGATPAAAQSAPPAQYFCLIVMDAFRGDYPDMQPMPALATLAAGGTSYQRAWVGQLESETPTGHASLSTGSMPKRTGVLGFEWLDPVTKQKAMDGWPPGVLAGDLERDLRASGTDSIPHAIKTAFPLSKVVALSSEKVYAADAMGGYAADYILYHTHAGPKHHTLVPSAVPGHVPPKAFFAHPNLQLHLPATHFTDWDWLSTMLAVAAIEEFRPKALMINLPGADVYGHRYGGPATPAVMKTIIAGLDRDLARILDAYKQAGIYNETLFVVTADHGMVPNDRGVGAATMKSAVQQAGGEHFFQWGGTGADIWLKNWWHARAVAEAMAKVPGVSSAYYQVNHHGQHQYVLAPGVSIDPALDAANQYLLSTFAGPRAPDVVAPFRENTIGETIASAHGEHGGLNWGAQHIPLVMSGPGVRAGLVSQFPARLIDVAPTVLRLLGIPTTGMDGTVLADAMINPAVADVATQSAQESAVSAYQTSLMTQSVENIAEDVKLGFHPPPSLPIRP